MCLKTKTPTPSTAKEDITVYKVIRITDKSLHWNFQYKPNTTYRLRQKLKAIAKSDEYIGYERYPDTSMKYLVDEGYHAFETYGRAFRNYLAMTNELFTACKIVKFTIPKGAKFLEGMDGDIVSTSIRSGDLTFVNSYKE